MVDELGTWDAVETAEAIERGDVSAHEVLETAIVRAERSQPALHAIAHAGYEDARTRLDDPLIGPFAGVPTFVKDLDNVAGQPTRFGTRAHGKFVAPETSGSVRQFLSTGLVSLGKSTTAEFGLTCTTEPLHGEATRNPKAVEHSSGGSSGGAASLVAAGVVPIAHASDGGGSIRIPASFCGLVGLKPSRYRLASLANSKRMPVKLATYGVLSRSVRDTARFYAAVEKGERKSALSPIGLVEGPGERRLRIKMYLESLDGSAPVPGMRRAVRRSAEVLAGQGHHIEEIEQPFDMQLTRDFLLHWALMAAGIEVFIAARRGPDSKVKQLEPWTRALAKHCRKNLLRVPGAIRRLRAFTNEYEDLFSDCDILLSPATRGPAPRIGEIGHSPDFDTTFDKLMGLVPYTPMHNIAGAPAISLPMGQTQDGLPLGVQLAAPIGGERSLLELAFALEEHFVTS